MPKKLPSKAGYVVSFFSGVAQIAGLGGVFLHELLLDKLGQPTAFVIGFNREFVEALFFAEDFDLQKPLFRSFKGFSIPLSDEWLGRVVDGLGRPLDGLGDVSGELSPIFKKAPPIIDREPVSVPLSTGIKVIDATLPLGRGQRELIIGDRKLGKTTLVQDVVLNQKQAQPPVYCVYVICGQKEEKLQELVSLFKKNNAFLYTTVVAAPARTSLAEQYLAPFVGCTIGEYFRDRGKDALVVYDDLSKHAKVYRDIALLLERAPGREAYPGDIFSLHAGLLERAAKLSEKKGGGSLTALPIIETQEDDITSFIPTNLISITDGQIYLQRSLYQKGFLPAVNIGLSVSRVGSQAQPRVFKEVVGGIRLSLAQYRELEKLSRLEAVVSEETQRRIDRGGLLLQLLKQEKHSNISWPEQAVLFYAIKEGFFDEVEKEKWEALERFLLALIRNRYPDLLEKIQGGVFDFKMKEEIKDIVADFKREFILEKAS
jgi:F-type H+-transporting ATPase subunit alpha